jgi:hypothetical protein
MKGARPLLAIAALATLVGVEYFAMRDAPQASGEREASGADSHGMPASASAISATGAAAPRHATAPAVSPAPKPPGLRERYVTATDLNALLASLDTMAETPLAERLLYRAVILETCARYLDIRNAPNAKAILDPQAQRPVNRMVVGAPDPRQKGALAYLDERHIARECRGFEGKTIPKADVERAYADAAGAGNLAARARLIEKRMLDDGRSEALAGEGPDIVRQTGGKFFSPVRPTAGEQQQLVDALVSGDPVAIVEAGHVLTVGGVGHLRIGTDDVSMMYGDYTFALAACEFGYECGGRNLLVASACAYNGQCADSFEAYLRDWTLPPGQFAQVQANARAIADVIRRHDIGGIGLAQAPGLQIMQMGGELVEPRMVAIH